MATILEFRASQEEASSPRTRGRRSRRSAEIVIFPGVRYERWADPSAPTQDDKPSIKRDHLALAD